MLINLTIAENRWTVLGVRPDVLIYATTIGLAWYVGLRSPYRVLVTVMLMLATCMRVLAMVGASELLRAVELGALGVVFAVAGALIYGKNPALLQKCLVTYLALCIPIMILQMVGVSSFLMGWNIGYLESAHKV